MSRETNVADEQWSAPNPPDPSAAPFGSWPPPDATVPMPGPAYGDGAYGAPPPTALYGQAPYGYAPGGPPGGAYPPQGYGPGPHQPVPYGYGWGAVTPQNDGLAIASLVLAVLGWALCAVFAPAAVITGVMSRRRIRESNGALGGDGLAKAGLIVGAVQLGLVVIGIIVVLAVIVLSPPSSY